MLAEGQVHCVENTPTTRVFYLKEKCLGKPNISQIILRVWFLTLVLHCHLFLHPYLLPKWYNHSLKISVWNQVFWYEHDLSIPCRCFHRSKAQKYFWRMGFCSKCHLSPLIIFRVNLLQLSSFSSVLRIVVVLFPLPLLYKKSCFKRAWTGITGSWWLCPGCCNDIISSTCFLIIAPFESQHDILMLVLNTASIIHLSALLGTSSLSQWLWPWDFPSKCFQQVVFVSPEKHHQPLFAMVSLTLEPSPCTS